MRACIPLKLSTHNILFHVWCSQKLLGWYWRVHLIGLPVSSCIPDHQWSPRPDQVTRLLSHSMMYYSFGTSKTGPNNFILSYLCGRTIDAILLEILLQYIPGIDSLKRIIMQIFHRNVPDVNLSHLEIAWTFGMKLNFQLIQNYKYYRISKI